MYLTVWQPLLECIFRQIYLHIIPGNVMTHEVKYNIPIIISIFLINSD